MARIRTIKPEFWEDENVGMLTREARLLFMGAWNLADDEGILRWVAPYLKASIFMYDDDISVKDVEGFMDELVQSEMMFAYKAGKSQQTFGYIVNFRKHQKINRPQPSKLPFPSVQSPKTLEMYVNRDDCTCHLCGHQVNWPAKQPKGNCYDSGYENETATNPSLDHIVPKVDGGDDAPSNLKIAHVGCNKSRGARSVNDFTPPRSVVSIVGEPVRKADEEFIEDSLNDSMTEGNGKEGNGKEGNITTGKPVVYDLSQPYGQVGYFLTEVAKQIGASPPTEAEIRQHIAKHSCVRKILDKCQPMSHAIDVGVYGMKTKPGVGWQGIWAGVSSIEAKLAGTSTNGKVDWDKATSEAREKLHA